MKKIAIPLMGPEPDKAVCHDANYLLGVWTGWQCSACTPNGTLGAYVQRPFSVKSGYRDSVVKEVECFMQRVGL